MMGNWWGSEGWGMGFGFMFMILFWALIAAAIVTVIRWALRASDSPERRAPREKTPLEIVRERYARGEIGREEYEQLKRDLET